MLLVKKNVMKVFLGVVLLFIALPALAIGPQWMPGFPMRMGPSVMLMWMPVPGATEYKIFKSDKAGDLGNMVSKGPANNYMDMTAPMDISAFYTVKAVTGGADGDPSPVGKIIAIVPLKPPKINGHMEGEGTVSLRFDRVTGASFYNVYTSKTEGGPFNLVGSVQDTVYVDSTIEVGKTSYYQVSAVDANNVESPKSETYAYKLEKKVAAIKVQTWKQVDKVVEVQGYFFGPEKNEFKTPTLLLGDIANQIIYVADSVNIKVLNLNEEVVRSYTKPSGYKEAWGTIQGMALSANGNLWTTWSGVGGIRSLNQDGSVATEFKMMPPTSDEYKGRGEDYEIDKDNPVEPRGIAEDANGNLWVAELMFKQVHVYSQDGKLLKKFGAPRMRKAGEGDFITPTLIRYHKPTNRIYVVDALKRTFVAFDAAKMDFIQNKDGTPNFGWLRAGNEVGNFQEPRGIGFAKDNEVVIVDGIDGRIMGFDMDMNYKYTLVSGAGQKKISGLDIPMDVQIMDNLIFVADPLNHRVVIVSAKE